MNHRDIDFACDVFEATFNTTASAVSEHVAATTESDANVRDGLIIVRVLEAVVKNKFANNPANSSPGPPPATSSPPKKNHPLPNASWNVMGWHLRHPDLTEVWRKSWISELVTL